MINVPMGKISNGVMHPAMFPVPLAEILIKTFCPPCGVAADVFAGSGSTLLAAQSLGHPFYGFELMPAYVKIARQRLKGMDELAAILEDAEDLGSTASQQQIRDWWGMLTDSSADSFSSTLSLLSKKHRTIFDLLPKVA